MSFTKAALDGATRTRSGDRWVRVIDCPRLIAKEDAACCLALRDRDGRLPIGYCGPDCARRR